MRYNSHMPNQPVRIFLMKLLLTIILGAVFTISQSGCIPGPKAPEHLRILFTTDTQGNFTPCGCSGGPRGGIQARSTAIHQERESAPGAVLLLDTGNFSTGFVTDIERTKAEFVIRAMAQLNYDAVNVGRYDVRRPRGGVLSFNQPGCPLTSAGYTYQNDETAEEEFSYPSSVIVDIDGFKIGIIGAPMDDLDESQLGFENEPTTTGPELLNHMRSIIGNENVQIIILITDNSLPWDNARMTSSRFKLASIIIAGQSADLNHTESKSGEEISHPVFIPRAQSWGRSLGVLDLEMSRSGGIKSYSLRYIDLNDDIEKDPAFDEMTAEYLRAIDAPATGLPVIAQVGYIGSASCRDCHLHEFETWENTRHAEAWETLESLDRLRESTCIPCHTTGYTASESFPSRMVPYEFRAVGCESCHGPGEPHKLFQEWRLYGELTGEDRVVDETDPIILWPDESTCVQCHIPPHDEGWIYNTKIQRVLHD